MADLLILIFVVTFIIVLISSVLAFFYDIKNYKSHRKKVEVIPSAEKEDIDGDIRESS